MPLRYINITGNSETRIDDLEGIDITNMIICNTHATDSVSILLYYHERKKNDRRNYIGEDGNWDALTESNTKYHILYGLDLPNGVTLSLDQTYFNNVNYYGDRGGQIMLFIKLNAADSAVTLLIDGKINRKYNKENMVEGEYLDRTSGYDID